MGISIAKAIVMALILSGFHGRLPRTRIQTCFLSFGRCRTSCRDLQTHPIVYEYTGGYDKLVLPPRSGLEP